MSFYRITDPKKRDAMVADYIATVKRLKQRNLNERLGDLAHKAELNETINPIIESNEKSSTAITNELIPMKKEIEDLNKHFRGQDLIVRGEKRKNMEDSRRDMYYGTYEMPGEEGVYQLGNKRLIMDKENNIHIDGVEYKGTPGLWRLVYNASPKDYDNEDWKSYKKLAIQTDLINNPSGLHRNSRPHLTKKYKLLTQALEEEDEGTEKYDKVGQTGSGIQFLPATIKALFEKLKLLAAEFIAGNTTTRNELVAVLDQLQRRKQISEKEYTAINTLLSQ